MTLMQLLSKQALLESVEEVDYHPDCEPDEEAHDRDGGQTEHKVEAGKDPQDRYDRNPWGPESSRPVRIPHAQYQNPDTDQDKREQRPDIRQVDHLVDTGEHRADPHGDAGEDRRDVRGPVFRVHLCERGGKEPEIPD